MPYFRLVLTESKNPPRGKFQEVLGSYDPRKKTSTIKKERVLHWISKGVQLSDTANNFLVKNQVVKGKKIAKHKVSKKAEEKTETAPAA